MNANEVLATLATRSSGVEIHPNYQVNASQSSNDTLARPRSTSRPPRASSGICCPHWKTPDRILVP